MEVPETSSETHLLEAVSANKEFSRFGYSLDTAGILALAKNDPSEIRSFTDAFCHILDTEVGLSDFASAEPFYPNFPEEVMEKSEFELAINAMFYYAFSQTDDPKMKEIAQAIRGSVTDSDRILREPLSEEEKDASELKILALAKETDMEDMLHDRICSMAVSEEKMEQIKTYTHFYPDWIDRLFPDTGKDRFEIPSHEIRSQIAAIPYREGDLEQTQLFLPKAEDVLRFAAVLSHDRLEAKGKPNHMDANLSCPVRQIEFSLGRGDKTAIKGMLEKTPDLFTSPWHREDAWNKLMGRLDTKDERFPRVTAMFDNLRNGDKVDERGVELAPTAGQALERFITRLREDPDRYATQNRIQTFAGYYPKTFVRAVERIGRELPPGDMQFAYEITDCLWKTTKDVPAAELLKLAHHLDNAEDREIRVFTNKSGNVHVEPNLLTPMDPNLREDLHWTLEAAVRRNLKDDRFNDASPMGKVYIDPDLENCKAPMRTERNASSGAVLTRYSSFDGKADQNLLAFGIFWKNRGGERADIDLSVSAYRADGSPAGKVYYDNLMTAWGVHSGDYTDGVVAEDINGAVEYVFVDKDVCKEQNIAYLIPHVQGFNIPFCDAESVRFCFMEKKGSFERVRDESERYAAAMEDTLEDEIDSAPVFDGELVEPTEIRTSFRLVQNSDQSTPLIYRVDNDRVTWVDASFELRGIKNVVNSDSISKSAAILYEAEHNDIPTMKELFTSYVQANRGVLVTDIKEADLVFAFGNIDREALGLSEHVEIISSFELDKISKEFSAAVAVDKDHDAEKDAVAFDADDKDLTEREAREISDEETDDYDDWEDDDYDWCDDWYDDWDDDAYDDEDDYYDSVSFD